MESLEPRRLLSLSYFGSEQTLPFAGEVTGVDVATAADGRSIIAARTVSGQDATYRVIRYDASGQQIGNPLTIDSFHDPVGTNGPRGDANVAVSINDAGQAIVAYAVPEAVDQTEGIYIAHIDAAGVVSEPFLVDAVQHFGGFDHWVSDPAVSIDSAGGYFVGWIRNKMVTDGSEAVDSYYGVMQAFTADDQPKAETGAFGVGGESDDRGYVEDLDIATKPDGNGAVFTQTLYRNYEYQIDEVPYGQTSTSERLGDYSNLTSINGHPDDIEPHLFADDADQPSIDINPDGSFVIAFRRYQTLETAGDATRQAAYALRFDAAGEPVGDPIGLGESLGGQGVRTATHSPTVALLPDGGFLTAFFQFDGEWDVLYARHYNADSTPDNVPPLFVAFHPINPVDDYGEHHGPRPVIAADALGRASLVYLLDGAAHLQRLGEDTGITLVHGSLIMLGTDDDDVIAVRLEDDNIIAERNSVTQSFPASDVQFISINALAGNDEITNDTALPSTLSGGEGDDTVYGGDADDKIRGEAGRDSLWGREGKDSIFGDDGVDSCYGNGGRDRIDGGANSDHMRGNSGRDKLFGGHGNDRIYGSESADWLYGGIGDDQLFGEGSNDILDGEAGADTLSGSAGDDVLHASHDGVVDQLYGDRGRDTAYVDDEDSITGIESLLSASS